MFFFVLFLHEFFIKCDCTAVFVKSCLDVVAWGKLGVDVHDYFLCVCGGGVIEKTL